MIASLAKIDFTLQQGITFGVIGYCGDGEMLNKVGRMVRVCLRTDAEHNGQHATVSRNLAQRHGYLVSGMETKVET